MDRDWPTFLLPYEQAVNELKIKLRARRKELLEKGEHTPIEFVTGRVKPVASIKEKMHRRVIDPALLEEDMQDIAGLRVQCQFVEDIYDVVALIRERSDMHVVEERDYVKNDKPSGYRSYHVVIEYSVQMAEGEKKILAEIQIRTLAMNFWATIEHSLSYKYPKAFPEEINDRLKRAAEAAFMLDKEMSAIREEIQDAQTMYRRGQQSPDDPEDPDTGDENTHEDRNI